MNREETRVANPIAESKRRVFRCSLFLFENFRDNSLEERQPVWHAHPCTHPVLPTHDSPALLCPHCLHYRLGSVGPGKGAGAPQHVTPAALTSLCPNSLHSQGPQGLPGHERGHLCPVGPTGSFKQFLCFISPDFPPPDALNPLPMK